MERIKYYFEKYKLIIILIMIIILFILTLFLYKKDENKEEVNDVTLNIEEKNEEVIEKEVLVKVDIKGYVKKPGVYEVNSKSRIIDVINKAGGLLEDANTEYINLSKIVTDQMVIIIYSNKDLKDFKKTDKEIIYIEYECKCPDNINNACINKDDIVNTNGVKEKDQTDTKVSINTASLEELMTLSGIGESKAKAIIEYREKNNGFKSLEDIMNVSGIGEAAYTKIKDYIKL